MIVTPGRGCLDSMVFVIIVVVGFAVAVVGLTLISFAAAVTAGLAIVIGFTVFDSTYIVVFVGLLFIRIVIVVL